MILFLIKNIFENIICEYHTYIISTLSSIQFNSFHVPTSKTPFPIIVTFMCWRAHTHPNKFTSCFSYVHVFWAVPLILGPYTWEEKNTWFSLSHQSFILCSFSPRGRTLGSFPIHIKKSVDVVITPILFSHSVETSCVQNLSRRPYQTAAMLIFWPLLI